jgi:predicted PurR-regulated permease PerM
MTGSETREPRSSSSGRAFFLALFAVLALLTILVARPYLGTIGLALLLVVVLQPLYRFFRGSKWAAGQRLALTLTLLSATLVGVIPIYVLLTIAFREGQALFNGMALPGGALSVEQLLANLEVWIEQIVGGTWTIDTAAIVENIRSLLRSFAAWLGNLAVNLGMSIPALFAQLTVFVLLLILWIPRYTPDRERLVALSPLPTAVTRLYLQKATAMLNAMFRGVFVISFAQGAAMGVFLWLAGVPFTFFLTVLSMFLAVLPVIGVFLVAWPVGIILLLTGQIWQGLLVIGGYLLVIINIDNLLRPLLVPKEAYLTPAFVLLSVLGGIELMGLLGAFYGPVILILLVTTVEVYAAYYAAPSPT